MLSDKRILEELGYRIVIEPFRENQLGTNSYDLRLGEHFYRQGDRYDLGTMTTLDPYDESAVRKLWQYWHAPYDAIILRPGEMVLGHTEEFIGGRNGFVGYLRARSSIGRIGVTVANCAGMGDVGYINRWTMEMTNHLTIPIKLRIGSRVAQMVFFEVGETQKQYKGKYQTYTTLLAIMKEWSPEQMLPKLWKDKDVVK